jgi:hypothetical protein
MCMFDLKFASENFGTHFLRWINWNFVERKINMFQGSLGSNQIEQKLVR